jgi:hypothetical protein
VRYRSGLVRRCGVWRGDARLGVESFGLESAHSMEWAAARVSMGCVRHCREWSGEVRHIEAWSLRIFRGA